MLDANQVLDHYFLETRCAILELAATLDRFDRAPGSDSAAMKGDPRLSRIREALAILAKPSSEPDRAERVLLLFSDPA